MQDPARVLRGLAGVLLAGSLLGCGADSPAAREAPTAVPPSSSTASPSSPPARDAPDGPRPAPTAVSIPSLGLTEDLVDLGLDDGGTLEVPTDPDRVGWFTGGGRPGGPGPTVIVGHVDSTEGPAVFARLPELAPGDQVVVDDADGGRTTYAVSEVADVPQTPFPTEEVFGATAEDTLRLITCTGPYDAEAGRYTENRVVSAVTVD